MGRYITIEKDKAEELDKWVGLKGSELSDRLKNFVEIKTNLIIRGPFKHEGKDYFNGFVGVDMIFNSEQGPKFLAQDDEIIWYSRIKDIGKYQFDFSTQQIGSYYGSIPFEEDSEEALYDLTSNKQAVIINGFAKVERFVKWYCASLEGHKKVVEAHSKAFKKYLVGLENISL